MHPDNISPKVLNGGSARFFEEILNDGIDMVLLTDAPGKILFYSNNIPEAFGYSLDNILDHSVFEFIHPRDLNLAVNTLNRAIHNPGHPVFIELRVKTKFKAFIWVDVKVINRMDHADLHGIVCSLRIVQKEKEAKIELQRKEAFYRKLIEEGEEIIYLMDRDRKMHFLGENVYKILGYTPKELEDKNNFYLVHPDERSILDQAFSDALKNPGIPCRAEYRLKYKDGHYGWREGTITNKLQDPIIKAIVMFTRDISDRKKAEQRINHQRMFFEGILSKLPFPLAILDVENRFIYANQHYTNDDTSLQNWITGKTESEYLKKVKYSQSGIQKRARLFRQAVHTNESIEWKDHYTDEKGETKYALHHYCPIGADSEGRELILAYDIDITEIHKAEESLRERELLFRSTFEQAAVGIVNLSLEGRWIRLNNRFCGMLGYTQQELMQFTFEDITHKEDLPFDREIRGKIKNGELSNCSFEKRYIKKNGKPFWANVTLSMVKDENDKPQYFVGIIQDLNEKKKTEESLKAKNEELNTFIYRASHDLRGPIASLLGLVKVVRYDLTDEAALAVIDKVAFTAERLDEILTSLIDVTKIQQGILTQDPVDFKKTVKGILQTLENISGKSLITIHPHIENINNFYSDLGLVRSILQNLIENAIKYSKQNSSSSEVEIKISSKDDGVEIIVNDNGIGIREAIQQKVFDIFYRGTGQASGSGLGLYIVKSSVEKLGGTISLSSEENKGTAITVFLPSMK